MAVLGSTRIARLHGQQRSDTLQKTNTAGAWDVCVDHQLHWCEHSLSLIQSPGFYKKHLLSPPILLPSLSALPMPFTRDKWQVTSNREEKKKKRNYLFNAWWEHEVQLLRTHLFPSWVCGEKPWGKDVQRDEHWVFAWGVGGMEWGWGDVRGEMQFSHGDGAPSQALCMNVLICLGPSYIKLGHDPVTFVQNSSCLTGSWVQNLKYKSFEEL